MKAHCKFRVLSAGNLEISSVLTSMLGVAGIEVVGVETVAETLTQAKSGDFDAYVLCGAFPDGDGFSLCRLLKAAFPDIPIVFYTDDVTPIDRLTGLLCGAHAYIEKPYFEDIGAFISGLINEAILQKVSYKYSDARRRFGDQQGVGAQISL